MAITLTTGRYPIMTRKTAAKYIAMIHLGDCPRANVMASIAFQGRLHMVVALASGINAIVATRAHAYYFVVIHLIREHRYPRAHQRRHFMTCLTLVRRIDMRGTLTGGYRAIVAIDTDRHTHDFIMIHLYR